MPRKRTLTKAKPVQLDLTGSSPESEIANEAQPPPPKRSRPSRYPRKPVVEEEEDADLAYAMKLQKDEDSFVHDANGAQVAGSSGSSSRGLPALAAPSPPRDGKSGSMSLDASQDTDPKSLLTKQRNLFLIPGKDKKCSCEKSDFATLEVPDLSSAKALDLFLALGSLKCLACGKKICRGCWEVDTNELGVSCCAAQRSIVLFEVLDVLDSFYLTERLKKPVPLTASAVKAKKPKPRGKPRGSGEGVGYGSGATHNHTGVTGMAGMGYGTDYDDMDEDNLDYEYDADEYEDYLEGDGFPPSGYGVSRVGPARLAPPPRPKVNTKEIEQDKLFASALKVVARLLPSQSGQNIWDWLPHETLRSLLVVSTLPDLLADLLRNDSVSEWTRRSDVYFAMLDVLAGLSDSEATLDVLFGGRRDKQWSEGIGPWLRGEGEVKWERKVAPPSVTKGRGKKRKVEVDDNSTGPIVIAPSLYELLKRLITQAEAFRKAASSGNFNAEDAALLGLCGDISSAGDRCTRMLKIWSEQQARDGLSLNGNASEREAGTSQGKGKGKAVETGYTPEQYNIACRTLAYASVDLAIDAPDGGKSFPTHHYHKELAASANSQRPHGGFVHLAKELAVLSTNLPPGIFLRVDEARIDCIKCIIAGPEDTPYAGGLYEFDIFIPLQYPQVPPLVWLRTTGNNTVRFNPNLYAEGKVCLSILGTWPGSPEEMWQPSASTLLQVLISIQSMILGSNYPYFNEPGYGKARDSKQNKDYNSNVRLANVRHAQLSWLTDAVKDGIWGDVVAAHFVLLGPTLIATATAWAMQDPRMRRWLPSMNVLSGGTLLTPYPYGGANGHLVSHPAVLDGSMAATPGKTFGEKVVAPSPAAIGAERDLVAELKECCGNVVTWREPEFFRHMLS